MKTLLFLWLFPITMLLGDPPAAPNLTTGAAVFTSSGNTSSTKDDQELVRAYQAALKANPDLQALKKRLSDQLRAASASGQPPSEDLRKAAVAYYQALHAAMLKSDPNVGPIMDKMGTK